jgi:hypothetical protein
MSFDFSTLICTVNPAEKKVFAVNQQILVTKALVDFIKGLPTRALPKKEGFLKDFVDSIEHLEKELYSGEEANKICTWLTGIWGSAGNWWTCMRYNYVYVSIKNIQAEQQDNLDEGFQFFRSDFVSVRTLMLEIAKECMIPTREKDYRLFKKELEYLKNLFSAVGAREKIAHQLDRQNGTRFLVYRDHSGLWRALKYLSQTPKD